MISFRQVTRIAGIGSDGGIFDVTVSTNLIKELKSMLKPHDVYNEICEIAKDMIFVKYGLRHPYFVLSVANIFPHMRIEWRGRLDN
jgi:hypothetical protein